MAKVRLQSSHRHDDRGLDAYFSPYEAVASLLHLEAQWLPRRLWEPAAGDGAIVKPLRAAGYEVFASDIADYGLRDCRTGCDYLAAAPRPGVEGIITNPPYVLALDFAEKALREVGYLALLLRTNFLESTSRLPFFRAQPPARLWISSRRLPMMHRRGWDGPTAPSNTCFAWFVWDKRVEQRCVVGWFDWREIVPASDEAGAKPRKRRGRKRRTDPVGEAPQSEAVVSAPALAMPAQTPEPREPLPTEAVTATAAPAPAAAEFQLDAPLQVIPPSERSDLLAAKAVTATAAPAPAAAEFQLDAPVQVMSLPPRPLAAAPPPVTGEPVETESAAAPEAEIVRRRPGRPRRAAIDRGAPLFDQLPGLAR